MIKTGKGGEGYLVEDEVDAGRVLWLRKEVTLTAELRETIHIHRLGLTASSELCKLQEDPLQLHAFCYTSQPRLARPCEAL